MTVKPVTNRAAIIGSLAVVYIVWGSTYAANRIAIETIHPFAMSGSRFVIAGLLLYLITKLRGAAPIPRRQMGAAFISGAFLLTGGNGLIVAAQHMGATSGVAALGAAASPLWVALINGAWGRPPTRREVAGICIGFAGIVVLNHHAIDGNVAGTLCLVGGAFCWGMGSTLTFRYPHPDGGMTPALQMLSGGVFLIMVSFAAHEPWHMPSPLSAGALAYLIVFGSILAFSAYAFLLKTVRPALATSAAYVNPAIAVFLGAALLREPINSRDWIALTLILSGVVLVAMSPRPAQTEGAAVGGCPVEVPDARH